ncbi:MAG: (Fe-S)-binding protein [Deltaproteobacteria bacterium]|nr:(Fe-S)-binding protein [Deltaproteobacteria bacterium]MBW2200940.1 (Fe-S)-binding protein [Deltaproteobacteria bacterium]
MIDFDEERKRFEATCTACGDCVSVCPIIPMTDIHENDPASVMEGVLDVFRQGTADDVSRTRIYACMSCLACRSGCPEGLDPSMGLSLARELLQQQGDPMPRGLAFLLPEAEFNLMKAIESVQIKPAERTWVTDVEKQQPQPAKTVIFTGCTGIMQPDLISSALDLIQRIDPSVQALGGVDYCCGDTNLRAGRPREAKAHFIRLTSALDAFAPETIVFMCPTCNAFFDQHLPEVDWSWRFVTDFLAENLEKLGPLKSIEATVTIHDACHLVRGERPNIESPRKILAAIPGVQIVEMQNTRESALCCGGSAMAAIGKPGAVFRARRLDQARETRADILAPYCPGCQSVFATERPHLPFKIESVITLLARSAGFEHQDRLMHYLSLQDGDAVLRETEGFIQASELPEEKLRNFIPKYFRGSSR